MSHFKKRGSAGPGTVGCRMNFPRGETTVAVHVRDEVREAREHVLRTYTADILGQRPKEWEQSTETYPLKYNKGFSDARLTNTLQPKHLGATDKRMLEGTTHTFDKETYHAFDRGEVTVGWNHSTVSARHEHENILAAKDAKMMTSTAKRRDTLKTYTKPQDRFTQQMLEQRAAAEARVAAAKDLERKYGADGVAQMNEAAKMRPLRNPRRRPKTTQADLAAVSALPMTDSDDESRRQSQTFGSRHGHPEPMGKGVNADAHGAEAPHDLSHSDGPDMDLPA